MKIKTKKYKEFINYSESLSTIKEGHDILERALNPDKLKNISRLRDANDIKSILNIIQKDIDRVVDLCKSINFDKIEYSDNNNNIIEVNYNLIIFNLLNSIKISANSGGDEIIDRIFPDGSDDMLLEIEIDDKLLNRIDIINSMPLFIKGIDLGKKIYKKLIKDFNYISTFSGYEPSIDSSMVCDSISRDEDIFTFANDDNIISFWNDYSYNDIISKLKIFYKTFGSYEFDDKFLDKYKLTEESLYDIIIK
jgi:hypothetical protein